MPGYKKPKTWLLMLTLVLCVAAAAACSADKPVRQSTADEETAPKPKISTGTAEPSPEDESIDGMYEFDDNVYTNPLSSFIAVKGYMPYFEMTDSKLRIIDPQNDTVEEIKGEAALSDISQEEFDALFDGEPVLDGIPDISTYTQCSQYAVYKDTYAEYRVYQMGDEVWLAKLSNGHMWSIYRLIKTDDLSVGIIGGADGPTQVYVHSTPNAAR